jgi:tetratricopeptide (TPR) repeat protein
VRHRLLGPPPSTGDRVGPYVLGRRLGKGGLATVWHATGPDGDVAIKVMNPDKTTEEQVRRIHREFKAMSLADSPYVVKVLESGEDRGFPWLALEYVGGPTLEELIASWEENPGVERWGEITGLLEGIARALEHIHGRGLVHRDLKPSNLLVAPDGTAKLADFGSVKAPDQFTTNLTMAGHLVGTVAFMAPEQITEDQISPKADLYALGAVLYVMLTGRKPVESDSIAGYLAKHLMEDPRPPAEVDPRVPAHLSRLCMHLLRKDPSQRPRDASQVLELVHAPQESEGPSLFGRDEVLRQSERRLARLARKEGGSVALMGEGGSGRTALLKAIEAQAADHRLATAWVEGVALTSAVVPPQRPLLVLVDDLDRATPRALGPLPDWLEDPELLVIYGLVAHPERPLDEGTGELIDPLVGRLLLDPFDAPLHAAPLERRACIALLRDQGLSGSAATILGGRLHVHCEGNPRDVLYQLQACSDAGWLTRHPTRRKLAVSKDQVQTSDLPIPPARRAAVAGALERMPPRCLEALQALAVMGSEIDLQTLGSLCPGGPRAMAMADLEGLVRRRLDAHVELVGLARADVRQLVLEGLAQDRKEHWHRACAQLLLTRNRRRVSVVAERAAWHWLQGGAPDEALPLLVLAAQTQAARRPKDAATLAQRALQVAPYATALDDAKRTQLVQRAQATRGQALLALGQAAEALDALTAALEHSQTTDPDRAELAARLGMALVAVGRTAQGRERLEEALATLPLGSPIRMGCIQSLAQALVSQGEAKAAVGVWETALLQARDARDRPQEARCLLGLAELEVANGKLVRANRALDLAEQRLSQETDPGVALIRCHVAASEVALLDGRYRVAHQRARRAIKLADPLDARALRGRAQLVLAELYLSAGQPEDTESLVNTLAGQERALPILNPARRDTLYNLGLQAQGPGAVRGLERLGTCPTSPPQAVARWELYSAWSLIRDGDRDAALQHAARAATASLAPGLSSLRMEALLCLGALGETPTQELKELVQRVLSGMPPEMRPRFVERLGRLGLFGRKA